MHWSEQDLLRVDEAGQEFWQSPVHQPWTELISNTTVQGQFGTILRRVSGTVECNPGDTVHMMDAFFPTNVAPSPLKAGGPLVLFRLVNMKCGDDYFALNDDLGPFNGELGVMTRLDKDP